MALEQFYGTGRRKTSTARVYLRPGRGNLKVNGDDWSKHFGNRPTIEQVIRQPLKETHTLTKYDIIITVAGGGTMGQAGAIRHGISRAIASLGDSFRASMKKAGFLTRDSRMVERKKPGMPKARKRFQFSKR